MATPIPKGKGKANEQTPLLDENGRAIGSSVSRNDTLLATAAPQQSSSSRLSEGQAFWRSYLITAVLATLTLLFGLILVTILLADSYAAPAWHNINKALAQSGEDSDRFWKQAMLVRGPDAISMTGVGRRRDGSGIERLEVNMTVAMRIAVDTDFIMDFRGAPEATWWKKKWRSLGRWSVKLLGSTTVTADSVIVSPSKLASSEPLITIKALSPITVPLYPGLSKEDHISPPPSLESVSVPLTIYPSQNASLLTEFLKQSWKQGYVSVRIRGSDLSIHGGRERSRSPTVWGLGLWRKWFNFNRDKLALDLTLPMPRFHIPSRHPRKPGSDLPELSDLLVLESFNITSIPSDPTLPIPDPLSKIHATDFEGPHVNVVREQRVLGLQNRVGSSREDSSTLTLESQSTQWRTLIFARASLAHPFPSLAPKLDLGQKFPPLPFTVSLPVHPRESHVLNATGHVRNDVIPVAKVHASPAFNVTHIIIPLAGYVLPFSNASAGLADAISAFVASYLSYRPSPISISTPLYPSLEVTADFPPPSQRLELLRDVKIEDMSIHPGISSGFLRNGGETYADDSIRVTGILASAIVHARVVLPRGIDIDVRVTRLWVDCFVFDGKAPPDSSVIQVNPSYVTPSAVALSSEDEEPPLPEPLPLPTPLPVRAFGRITPTSWLNATSSAAVHLYDSDDLNDSAGKLGKSTGTDVFVTAQVVDVPLAVLPGRQGDLSRFVTKVLFSRDPVVAGIRGIAAVGLSIPGVTIPASSEPRIEGNELILTGLPFEGDVEVGGHDF